MIKEFIKGIWKENPILVIMLGLCPALAVSTSAMNGVGMSLAFAFVLICSNIVIASIKKIIPGEIRIPAYIIVISTFVTIIDYSLKAYAPALSSSLGIFVPLIVVNCIVMGRAETFASKNGIMASLFDALGMSIGFTIVITLLASIRELLGNGTIFGYAVMPQNYQPFLIMVLPPGAFLVIGFLMALHKKLSRK